MTKNILDRELFTNEYPNYGIQNKDCTFPYKEFIITLIPEKPSLMLVYRMQLNSSEEAFHLVFTGFSLAY